MFGDLWFELLVNIYQVLTTFSLLKLHNLTEKRIKGKMMWEKVWGEGPGLQNFHLSYNTPYTFN